MPFTRKEREKEDSFDSEIITASYEVLNPAMMR